MLGVPFVVWVVVNVAMRPPFVRERAAGLFAPQTLLLLRNRGKTPLCAARADVPFAATQAAAGPEG